MKNATPTVTAPPTTTTHAITLDAVTKRYASAAGDVSALQGITHTFAPHTFTAVMGPSGSGKSTLLQCAAGLDQPSSGSVWIGDVELGRLGEVQATELRRRAMGFVFQSYNLLPALSAYDNVALPLRLAGQRPRRDVVLGALATVGLGNHHRRRPAELSGGQQQRVAIARALVARPSVVFADEPTGALDRATSRDVLAQLRAAVDRDGLTIVMVTHDPVAAATADSVLFLQDGRVVGSLTSATATQIAAAMSEMER
ncbi:ABC transporter ATP-binding protein [Mumia sp. ZJ430]|uniref:ABC transporter ATP-binding protein n=1 Tax=Mumia sp. ZJ430 TaxID=2708083 RepID=UPI0014212BD9|nr:ABC transporter ATP-binding protein [Mumia sp. ZJ430]